MTQERRIEIKNKMREKGVKHYILTGTFWTVHGLAKHEINSCCYSDKELEEKANELYKFYETLDVLHA